MSERKSFYITTPIFYPNARLHLGHAYTATVADVLARYHRLMGKETYFLTGADENTEKVVRSAKALEREPKEYLNEVVANFKSLFSDLNISYDQFIRTSDDEIHWPGAQLLWRKLVEAGDIEKRSYQGLYCVGHESFITEKELVDGKCPDHGEAPEKIAEENYFFKLSKYTEQLKEKIKSGELAIVPQTRQNEVLALMDRGLEDVSFSRPKEKVSVGIPVPDDDSQVMYVWCDALSNYITALGFGRDDQGLYKKFWPADLHVMGKDILRFHGAIWPAMLLSAGLPLPQKLLIHGFIKSGGKKMSKTIGNVIDPEELIKEYGAEAVRYYLLRHISPFEDGEITVESFKEAYNANLANGLGNLVSRVMKMAEDHLDQVPEIPEKSIPDDFKSLMENLEIQKATDLVWQWIARLDEKIQTTQPFKLIKTDKDKAIVVIKELVVDLYTIGRMLNPLMPETNEKIKAIVKTKNKPAEPLFRRID